MEECTPAFVPMNIGLKLALEEDSPTVDAKRFQQIIGMLIYLVNTKTKILFVIRVLSHYMHSPRVPHMEVGEHILRYIKGLLDFGIFYGSNESPTIIGYTDTDWANCRIDKKSITGSVFKFVVGPIFWSSKKQDSIVVLSTDAKAKALADGIWEAFWL